MSLPLVRFTLDRLLIAEDPKGVADRPEIDVGVTFAFVECPPEQATDDLGARRAFLCSQAVQQRALFRIEIDIRPSHTPEYTSHEFFARLRREFEGWAIAPVFASMFGSVARGEMTSRSDIDVLVVRADVTDPDTDLWRDQCDTMAERASQWTGNGVQLLEAGATEVRDAVRRSEPVYEDIARDGIALYGPRNFLRLAMRA